MDIYSKIYNDIMSFKMNGVYIVNQEGDYNKQNSFNKRGWKYYINGGKVAINKDNYFCSYYFDIANDKAKYLSFTSFIDNSGLCLLDFIDKVNNCDKTIFTWNDGYKYYDLSKYLYKVNKIEITNSNIDKTLINTISKYFNNLDSIIFNHCKIDENCNFNIINCKLEFNYCIIDSNRVFNDFAGELKLDRSNFNKIANSNINSPFISLNGINNNKLKLLFLMSNFPNLINLQILGPYGRLGYSFEDCLEYVPDACKSLEYLYIKGKVKSMDFIYRFKNLLSFDIYGATDDYGFMYANVSSKKELEKIKERNKLEIDIEHILNPYKSDKLIIASAERKRILRLTHFLKMISYTEELYNTLTDNKDIINYLMNIKYNDITSYYESYFDRLIYYKKSLNKGNFLFDESNYKLLDKYLFKDEKGIVKCRDFMFHEDGNLILFQHAKKEIINITSAKEFMSDKIVSNFNLESYELNKYLDFLMNIDCDIKIGQLEDYCMEEFHKNISIKNMELFENSNDIKRIIQMRDRGIDRLNNIAAKQLIIIDKLQNLLLIYMMV